MLSDFITFLLSNYKYVVIVCKINALLGELYHILRNFSIILYWIRRQAVLLLQNSALSAIILRC